jgi:steroid 5-alpha reductase family enzyme
LADVAWPHLTPFVPTLAIITAAMVGLWLVSLVLRDASIADLFWGPGFAIVGWASAALTNQWSARPFLVNVLVTLWALRLALHLFRRHHGEDPRYRAMRERYGARFPFVSLAIVFLFQGLLLWVVSWPVQAVHLDGVRSLGVVDLVGVAVWAAGMVVETVADAQLTMFKRDPGNQNKVMDKGLWRYSRHPELLRRCRGMVGHRDHRVRTRRVVVSCRSASDDGVARESVGSSTARVHDRR